MEWRDEVSVKHTGWTEPRIWTSSIQIMFLHGQWEQLCGAWTLLGEHQVLLSGKKNIGSAFPVAGNWTVYELLWCFYFSSLMGLFWPRNIRFAFKYSTHKNLCSIFVLLIICAFFFWEIKRRTTTHILAYACELLMFLHMHTFSNIRESNRVQPYRCTKNFDSFN